jgi:hypothetical protein
MANDEQLARPPLFSSIIRHSVRRSAVLSACISSVIVSAGWLLIHFAMNDAIPSAFAALGATFLFPGIMAAGFVASVFVSGGIHSIDVVFGIAPPVSWLVYFIFSGWLFDPRRKTAK